MRKAFGLDLRSLAAFRIGLGLLILLDLAVRALWLRAHYTDFGVLPRELLVAVYDDPWYWSFHLWNGSTLGAAMLFLLAAVSAVSLVLGYRTRLASFVCWTLTVSLQNRNYVVLNSGDVYFRMLLFWAMFLPIGARYSVDRALRAAEPGVDAETACSWFSMASVALIVQILFVYLFAGLLKLPEPSWREGLGVYYALSLEQFSTPLGHWLSHRIGFLKLISPLVLAFEVGAPWLAIIPWRTGVFRLLAVALFWSFHLANIALLEIGLFSFIGLVAWVALLPAEFWEGIRRSRAWKDGLGLTIHFDQECGICLRMLRMLRTFLILPMARIEPAQADPAILQEMRRRNSWIVVDRAGKHHDRFDGILEVLRNSVPGAPWARLLGLRPIRALGDALYRAFASHRPAMARFVPDEHERSVSYGRSPVIQILVSLMLAYVVVWNLGTLPGSPVNVTTRTELPGFLLRIDQNWEMFSRPILDDGWFVADGTLRGGEHVDPWGNRPVSWEKPDVVSATFATDRWRKYMIGLYQESARPAGERLLLGFGRYICRAWNEEHDGGRELETFELIFMREDLRADGTRAVPRKVSLWVHRCFD